MDAFDEILLKRNNNMYAEHFSVSYSTDTVSVPFMIIMYAAHGCGGFKAGGVSGEMTEGDAVLIKPNVPCAFYSTDPARMMSVYYCAFFPEALPCPQDKLKKEFPEFRELLLSNGTHIKIHDNSAMDIRRYMVRIVEDFFHSKPCMEYTMKSLITLCIIDMLKISERAGMQQDEPETNAAAGAVINYINLHLHEKISEKEIADMLHITPQHLCRLFKKQTGMTIIEFTNKRRVERIKDALENTDRPIYMIYDDFDLTTRYISQIFRRYAGCSMRQYKREFGSIK